MTDIQLAARVAAPSDDDVPQLELEHVSVGYDGRMALDDISVAIPHGAQVAVVGPNGAGKSTLFKALVGLLPLRQGRIRLHGKLLPQHELGVAYVPQRGDVDWAFPVTVMDVVMMGRYGKLGWFKRPTREDERAVQRALEQMGIAALARRPIGDLSGGQQQRAFLARALAQEPHILLMDEPFTGVDITTLESTLALMRQLKEQDVTTLVSTHDLNLAATHFDRVLLLKRKLIAYGTADEVMTARIIAEAFGSQALFLGNSVLVDQCCPPEDEQPRDSSVFPR